MSHLARHLRPSPRRDKTLAGLGVLLMVIAASTASTGVAAADPGANGVANGDPNGKITICHRTDSDTNPYVIETPDKNGDVSGHAATSVDGVAVKNGHGGPVWNPTLKDSHLNWGDIIPAFDFNDNGTTRHFDGQNLTPFGQLFLANDCNIPTPKLTVTLVKDNDADGDQAFSDSETAPAVGAAVPFKITVTNTSIVPVTIGSLSDALGVTPIAFTCTPSLIGVTLAPQGVAVCTFTLPAYSPAAGTAAVNTATVVVSQAAGPNLPADSTNTATAQDTSTVRSPEIVTPTTPPATTPPPTTAPPTTPPATTPPPTTAPPTTPPASTPPGDAPDVAIVKTGPATASPGDTITWTLTVSNTGQITANDVTVTDTLPDGIAFVSATGLGWSCAYTTTLSCTDSQPLTAGATSPITVVGTLGAAFTGDTITNTAVVTPDDATPGDNTSSVTTTVAIPTQGGGGGGEVTGPGTPGTPSTPSAGGGGGGVGLPFTGAPIGLLMLVGQTLFAFGGMMLLLGRRRRA